MEGRKSKRGRGSSNSSHGRVVTRQKSTEVMNEKEEQDRLEAASALSSLMFLPPKSSEEDYQGQGKVNGINRSASSVTYISSPPLSGNPVCAPPGHAQASPRGSGIIIHGAPSKSESPQNSVILAHLQSRISHMLSTKQFSQPAYLVTPSAFLLNQPKSSQPAPTAKPKTLRPPEPLAPGVPSVVLSAEPARAPTQVNTTKTVTKEVATALRQAVSYSKKQEGSHLLSLQSTDCDDVSITSSSAQPANIPHTDSPKRNDNEKPEVDFAHKKKDNTDNNLPLKKRRLVGVSDSSDTANTQTVATTSILSTCLSDLTTTAQIENILQIARKYPTMKIGPQATSLISSLTTTKSSSGEGYRPIQFDPRTSLMVLSDVKLALTPDEDGDLPIHIAVVHENAQLVKKFIDIMAMSGKTVDRFNKLQQTPLHLAVLVNKQEIVADLLEAGANPNLMDRNGHTAIHLAITKQHHECLEAIFENSKHRCELNSRNFEGYPPLHTCVELNDLDSLMRLRKKGADINVQDGKAGRSVIFYATEYNRCDIVDALVKWGVNAELQNYAGVTPLMTAQAAQLDDIINKLQRALEGKFYCDPPQHSQAKKMPIPRIPSKSSLIVPDVSEQLSSDSLSRDSRHRSLSRRPSNSSPIDLSLTRNTDSPMVDIDRMWEQGSDTDSGIKTEADKTQQDNDPVVGLRRSVKEKHTQLVAALEGRRPREKTAVALPAVSTATSTDSANSFINHIDILTSYLSSHEVKMDNLSAEDKVCLIKLFLSQSKPGLGSLKPSKTPSAKVQQEENKTDRNTQEVVTKSDNVKSKSSFQGISRQENKSSPVEAGEDLSSDIQMKGEPTFEIRDDNFRTLDNGCQNTDLTKDNDKEETDIDMETQDSPEMPVLTRAFSVNAESDSNDENRPENNTEPQIEKITDTMNDEHEFKSQVSKDSSSGSLQGSQGFEIHQSPDVRDREVAMETDIRNDEVEKSGSNMEVDKKSHLDNGENSSSIDKRLVSSQEHVADKIQLDEINESDNRIQGNTCEDEMETEEEEESEEMPLIIDEGTSQVHEVCVSDIKAGKSQEKTDNRDIDCGSQLSQINMCHSKEIKKVTAYTVCKTTNKDIHRTTSDAKMEDSQDLSVDPNISDDRRSKHVEGRSEESHVLSIDHTAEDYKEKGSFKLSNMDESKTPLEGGSFVNESNKEADSCSDSTEVQARGNGKQGNSESADKASTVPAAEETVKTSSGGDMAVEDSKTHTVYLRDGESFKPIRILIDNSEKTSLLLQKMFQRNSNTSANLLVNSSLSDKVTGSPKTDQTLDSVAQPADNSLHMEGSCIASATMEGRPMSTQNMAAANRKAAHLDSVSGKTREGSSSHAADKAKQERVSDTVGFEMGLNLLSRLKVEKKQQEAKHLEENKMIRIDSVKTGPGTGKKVKSYIISNTLSKGKTEDPKLENSVHGNVAGSNGSPKKPKSENSKLKADSDDSVKTDSNAKNIPNLSHMTSIGNRRVTNQASSRGVVSLSEGTLTRVNPDIKSKLSKALQSPQRKLGQGKPPGGGDKDCVVPNFQGITGSSFTSDVPTSKTVVTESRQQL